MRRAENEKPLVELELKAPTFVFANVVGPLEVIMSNQ